MAKPTTEWGRRAAAQGLSRDTLALMVGLAPKNVTEALQGKRDGGVPAYLKTIILAAELMPPNVLKTWIATIRDRPTTEKEKTIARAKRAAHTKASGGPS